LTGPRVLPCLSCTLKGKGRKGGGKNEGDGETVTILLLFLGLDVRAGVHCVAPNYCSQTGEGEEKKGGEKNEYFGRKNKKTPPLTQLLAFWANEK